MCLTRLWPRDCASAQLGSKWWSEWAGRPEASVHPGNPGVACREVLAIPWCKGDVLPIEMHVDGQNYKAAGTSHPSRFSKPWYCLYKHLWSHSLVTLCNWNQTSVPGVGALASTSESSLLLLFVFPSQAKTTRWGPATRLAGCCHVSHKWLRRNGY